MCMRQYMIDFCLFPVSQVRALQYLELQPRPAGRAGFANRLDVHARGPELWRTSGAMNNQPPNRSSFLESRPLLLGWHSRRLDRMGNKSRSGPVMGLCDLEARILRSTCNPAKAVARRHIMDVKVGRIETLRACVGGPNRAADWSATRLLPPAANSWSKTTRSDTQLSHQGSLSGQ
jgi:hypothetical protein